jgi:hypothetical protein
VLGQFKSPELPTFLFSKKFKSTSEHGAGKKSKNYSDLLEMQIHEHLPDAQNSIPAVCDDFPPLPFLVPAAPLPSSPKALENTLE